LKYSYRPLIVLQDIKSGYIVLPGQKLNIFHNCNLLISLWLYCRTLTRTLPWLRC